MIWKNLTRRKTRTFLTLAGIAVGVAAVVALGAIAEGFISSYSTILTSSGADIIVTQEDAPDILFSAVDSNVGPQLASVNGVSQVAGVLLGLITTPDVPYFIIYGVDPKEFAIRHYRVYEGTPIAGARQILLGSAAARNFHKRPGDYFKVQDVSFKIVGLYETGQNVEEMGGVISLQDAQAVFKKPAQVTYYQLKLLRPGQTDSVVKELGRRFSRLTASRSANYMDNQAETQMLRAMGWFISLIAVLGGGLVMMNTMLMSVFERTREIGVLRALGWRRSRVLRMILGEAFLLSLLGGLLGTAVGMGLVFLINQIPVLTGFLDNAISPALFAQALVVALFLGAAGGIYPAWSASRLQPVEAMRYEGGSSKSQAASSKLATASDTAGNDQKGNVKRGTWDLKPPMELRNLMRQKTRTLLTTLAIGIGVGLVVTLGGIGEGVLQQFGAMGNQTGDLIVTEAKASDISLAAIDDKVGRFAATLPGIQSVSGMLIGIATLPGTPYFIVFGLDTTSFGIRHFAITEGERVRTPQEIIVGRVAAKNMKKRVGDTIKINNVSYRLVGIYETGIAYEDGGAVLALPEAQRVFRRPNQVSAFGLKLRDPSQSETIKRQIESRFPQVAVSRSTEFAEKTNDMNTFRAETNALSFLSIFIGGIGMMNAMLMSVYERTREIGTLRALGWRRRRIVLMIVREALLLSLLSGIAGIILGISLGKLIEMEPSMGSMLVSVYPPTLLAQALVIALILGAIGALYPAWRASGLQPVEALRYE